MDLVSSLVDRVDSTRAEAAGRFPEFADPLTGEWTWSDGTWTSGYWVGLLRLAGIATGDAAYERAAVAAGSALAPLLDRPSVLLPAPAGERRTDLGRLLPARGRPAAGRHADLITSDYL